MKVGETFFLEVFFTGRVQGVGFRWSAHKVAQGFPVRGFVKNLPDGRVQMVVEGEMSAARSFLAAVQERMATCVESCEITEKQGPPKFTEFSLYY